MCTQALAFYNRYIRFSVTVLLILAELRRVILMSGVIRECWMFAAFWFIFCCYFFAHVYCKQAFYLWCLHVISGVNVLCVLQFVCVRIIPRMNRYMRVKIIFHRDIECLCNGCGQSFMGLVDIV